jgi:hypothetical protein
LSRDDRIRIEFHLRRQADRGVQVFTRAWSPSAGVKDSQARTYGPEELRMAAQDIAGDARRAVAYWRQQMVPEIHFAIEPEDDHELAQVARQALMLTHRAVSGQRD